MSDVRLRRSFRAVLEMDLAAVSALRARDAVVVVARAPETAPPNAVWLTWPPQARTIVRWSDVYGVFASAVPVDAAPIAIVAVRYPASFGARHPYAPPRFTAFEPLWSPARRHVEVRNDDDAPTGFGLIQPGSVNASAISSPLNCVVVPPGFTANFTTPDRLFVWIADGAAPGSWIATPPLRAAIASFADTDVRHLLFDRHAASFRVAPP